jgi:Ca-activated chloride channel family protein
MFFLFIALLSLGMLLADFVHAGDAEMRPEEATSGTLFLKTQSPARFVPAPALDTDVHMDVSGPFVRATVRQTFTNPAAEWAEGVYVFPLPENAAVDHLTMQIGDRIIAGQIKERPIATEMYEQARREGKRASLLTQERPNIFTVSVANIDPHGSVRIEIQYQQVLPFEEGRFRLRFPMVVGPRYIPGLAIAGTGHGWARDTTQVPDASRITPPVAHPREGLINPVRLQIDLAPGFALASLTASYHRIDVSQAPDNHYRVTLADGAVPADRDFELVWELAADRVPDAKVFSQQVDGESYHLLMLLPPSVDSAAALPREVIFVIDTSGSMAGSSIAQARAALELALGRLRPQDSFNVIQFNSIIGCAFAQSMPATMHNLEAARAYVRGLRATGGTEMLPALMEALDGRDHPGRLRQIVFLTDGAVGNERQLFAAIRERLGDSRLFTIGIGSAPNSHFMRTAAETGRGTFTYIGKIEEVREKMEALYRKLEHPALTDIAIDTGEAAPDLQPARVADLYRGEPIVVAFKSAASPLQVIVRGRHALGPWKRTLLVMAPDSRPGVAAFWARRKIDALMEYAGGTPEEDLRTRGEIMAVAIQHHLVSRYTSLVAVDVAPARPAGVPVHPHAMKTNLPDGWSYEHVFGPQTATPAGLEVVIGLMLLSLAWCAARWRARHAA